MRGNLPSKLAQMPTLRLTDAPRPRLFSRPLALALLLDRLMNLSAHGGAAPHQHESKNKGSMKIQDLARRSSHRFATKLINRELEPCCLLSAPILNDFSEGL
jgi:hypothetical protein